MQDARFLRSQAELCLEVAEQLRNLQAAEILRARAAEYYARAVDLELGKPLQRPPDG